MNKPYIICHMMISLDGKVTGGFLSDPSCAAATEEYFKINREYAADAFACGRVTMEESFTAGWQPDLSAFTKDTIPREDYIAHSEAGYYAVSFDRHGRLGWRSEKITDEDPGYDNAYIIEVLCEDTPDANLAYYRSIGVSYIFAGEQEIDLKMALDKLYQKFGIRKLMLEGGSDINGAFAREGVINELSLVMAPVTAGADGKSLFPGSSLQAYELMGTKQLSGGSLWLNYRKPYDNRCRCGWCKPSEKMIRYHDEEWGLPLHDDRKQFEFLMMEAMQCGLSWNLMIEKREIFRQCFDEFDYEKIVAYTEADVDRILNYPGMIRSPRKIQAIISNARVFLKIREEYGSFDAWLWSFSGNRTILYQGHQTGRLPAANSLSDEIAVEMKKRGFKYLGSVTVYAHLQACGIINDHTEDCFRYREIVENYPVIRKRRQGER